MSLVAKVTKGVETHLTYICLDLDAFVSSGVPKNRQMCLETKQTNAGKFVYPGWADVTIQSALSEQTKRTHLAEMQQKPSLTPLSPLYQRSV